jgi:GntR family transcriptional regulator
VDDKWSSSAVSSDLPAYARVKSMLRSRILSGEIGTGQQLPTQAELCREFGVSRITITRALNDLEMEGLVERRQGVGTFVRLPLSRGILTNAELLYKQTFTGNPASEHLLLSAEVVTGHPTELGGALAGAGDLWKVVRLRKVGDARVGYEESYIPVRVVPSDKSVRVLERMLLFDFLTQDCGISLSATRVHMSATKLSREVARHLGVKAGDPALILTRETFATNGRPVTVSFNTLPAQVSSYFFEFRHSGDA